MERILNAESKKYVGGKIKVCGWVNSRRDHGRVIFIDLRDRSGLLQIVFGPDSDPETYRLAKELKPEWVIEVVGEVKKRPKGMENPKIETGEVEVLAEKIKIFSKAKALPFPVDTDGYEIKEEKRLRYRYLDLRRKRLQRNLKIRQEVIHFIRSFLKEKGFIEVETPILTKSTPEGARDFLVPSRLYPGKFYALPQSPQQYKQLLQVSGIEKYFQIAKCLRDEDPRADRQPEFTQLDIEMSFVEQEDVLKLTEELFIKIVETFFCEKKILQIPFPRISYEVAKEKYRSDKPDIRKNKKSKNELGFLWVIDFPMFEWKETEKRWDAVHHPFTRPKAESVEEIKKNPEKILAYQYDIVLNGEEIGGGSLRSYRPEILEAVFEVMGHSKKEIREKFKHLFEAFEYGVPPHGGIAIGLDRFLAILLSEPNIREVIAFPKTGDFRDLMMDLPSEVSKDQLKELSIKIVKPRKKK
jgi:aspartyl-tRNA synthetase